MNTFTPMEVDTLQELMNISFGQAAADLTQVVDVFVQLQPPDLDLLPVSRLETWVRSVVPNFDSTTIVEQQFHGETSGLAVLIFPKGSEKLLLSFFEDSGDSTWDTPDMLTELEREVLMEIGNILVGACVSKLFELLDGHVTYLPPGSAMGHEFASLLNRELFAQSDYAIALRTSFAFEDRDISGYMILINRQESIPALKQALAEFWSKYS